MLKLLKRIMSYFYFVINGIIFYSKKIDIKYNFKILGIIFIRNHGKCLIGSSLKVNSGKRYNPIGGDIITRFIILENANLVIGNNVGISNSTIFVSKRITIEDNVMIGGGCKIWDTNFHSINSEDRINNGDKKIKSSPIVIKKNVFIGGSSIILKGVTIEENSIIAAGSVVVKDIPKNEIWGGNPAKFIKKIR